MRRRYVLDASGWRSLVVVSKAMGVSPRTMYGKSGGFSPFVNESIRMGFVETRIFPGERGRGGKTSRFRVAYDRKPVQNIIDDIISGKTMGRSSIRVSVQKLSRLRVAVLPFASLSPDQKDDYFADGMTDELITSLSQIRRIEVISRTSVMRYKGKSNPIGEVSRELRAGTVLEGSVRKEGSRIRVSIQMIDAASDRHLWAENYDRDLGDVLAVQTSIAENVADTLRLRLLKEQRRKMESKALLNPEAYVEYLKGLYFARKVRSEENLRKAIMNFENAMKLEPRDARTAAWLGNCYFIMGWVGYDPTKPAYEKCTELSQRALDLDNDNSEAHAQMAIVDFRLRGKWAAAERHWKRAIELNPNFVEARAGYAGYLSDFGRNDLALIEAKKVLDLNPVDFRSHVLMGALLGQAGRYQEAMDHLNQADRFEPESASTQLGFLFLRMGRFEDSIKEFGKSVRNVGGSPLAKSCLGFAYGLSGRRSDALRMLEEIKRVAPRMPVSYHIAVVYAGLGDKARALHWLEESFKDGSLVSFPLLHHTEFFIKLRNEPKFKDLVVGLGLDEHKPAY